MLKTIELHGEYFDELTGCVIQVTEVIPGGVVRAKALKVPLGQRGRNKRFIGDKLVTPVGFLRFVTEEDHLTFMKKGAAKKKAKNSKK